MPTAVYGAMLSSMLFNYITKQKIGGSYVSIGFVKQIPVLTLDQIPDWAESLIIERVAELCYFNHDLDGWMYELWHGEEMMDDIHFTMLDRPEECNNLYFDDDIYPMPEFSNMQPYIHNEQRRPLLKPSWMPSSPTSTALQPRNCATSSTRKIYAAKAASMKLSVFSTITRCVSTANTAPKPRTGSME